MIDREHEVSIKRQAELVGISRGSVYYQPRPVSAVDLALMRRIDELHLEHPFMGARMLRGQLNRSGVAVGRKHVGSLMARMGIAALYPGLGAVAFQNWSVRHMLAPRDESRSRTGKHN
jgi:putative transposase